MDNTYTVGHYLLDRLAELGIKHIFGVPGDYVLGFIRQIEADERLHWVANCNELNAAYAAEGYGRMARAGAVVVTGGVGDLSASCGIGGRWPSAARWSSSPAPPGDRSRSGTRSATSTTVSARGASTCSRGSWRR